MAEKERQKGEGRGNERQREGDKVVSTCWFIPYAATKASVKPRASLWSAPRLSMTTFAQNRNEE